MCWHSSLHREDPITVYKCLSLEPVVKKESIEFERQQLSDINPVLGRRRKATGVCVLQVWGAAVTDSPRQKVRFH